MINNKLKKNLTICIVMGLIFLVSCHFEDGRIIYPVSEEEYLMGWVLHNIYNTDATELSFTEEELAKYNYVYNYPADAPVTYDNVLFWVAPFQSSAAAAWTRLGAPQNRIYYLKGDMTYDSSAYEERDWSFTSYMHINYLTSEDFDEQFGLDIAHQEHYKSEHAFYGINPVPGWQEIVYFGTSTFTPPSVIVAPNTLIDGSITNTLILNDKILKGHNGKSYLSRETLMRVWDSSTDIVKEIMLDKPKYKIYLDGIFIKGGDLINGDNIWDYTQLYYPLEKEGNYEVEINIPSGYPVFRDVLIKTKFKKGDKGTLKLPILKHIEFPPRFSQLEKLPMRVEFENREDIRKVSMYYKFDNMKDWLMLSESASSTLLVKSDDIKEISFKFVAETDYGSASYEIYPISLRRVYVTCKHSLRQETIKEIERKTVYLNGSCIDEKGNTIQGLRLEFYSYGKFLGATITDDKGYYFETERMYNNADVRFIETEGLYDKIDVSFKGTGVYSQR